MDSLNLQNLPVNWFDFVVVIVLLLGVLRGRKHGMSEELLPLLQWVAIILAAAYLYEPLGRAMAQATVFSLLTSYITCYLGVAVFVRLVFMVVRRVLGGKLLGSNVFGGGEYYLGMLAGMVRFACGLMAALALLNARYFSPQEIKAIQQYQLQVYGSHFFPGMYAVQSQVFQRSLLGPPIRQYLGWLLIKPTPPEKKQLQRKELDLP